MSDRSIFPEIILAGTLTYLLYPYTYAFLYGDEEQPASSEETVQSPLEETVQSVAAPAGILFSEPYGRNPEVGEDVYFAFSNFFAPHPTKQILLDYGDGCSVDLIHVGPQHWEQFLSHSYSTPGPVSIKLTLTDEENQNIEYQITTVIYPSAE